MAIDLDLRERAIVDGVRADLLERRLEDLWEPPPHWRWQAVELTRLRALAARQAQEIARLQVALREAQEAARLVEVQALVDAVLGAIERGSWSLQDLEVVEAAAELKVVLDVGGGRPGLVVGPAGTVDARALSAIRLELRRRAADA